MLLRFCEPSIYFLDNVGNRQHYPHSKHPPHDEMPHIADAGNYILHTLDALIAVPPYTGYDLQDFQVLRRCCQSFVHLCNPLWILFSLSWKIISALHQRDEHFCNQGVIEILQPVLTERHPSGNWTAVITGGHSDGQRVDETDNSVDYIVLFVSAPFWTKTTIMQKPSWMQSLRVWGGASVKHAFWLQSRSLVFNS